MADDPTNGVYEPIRRKSKANLDKSCPSFKITNINLDSLIPFADHPFKLYEGQRLEDLICSIKEEGVTEPIIMQQEKPG